ncbi:MAG: hypothetical protein J5865_04320 [Lachnospiraceae bacterium]|nr:hypothetical protein [Lachnospiraceae bacterium]
MATTEESLKFLDDARTAAEGILSMKKESEDKAVQLKRLQKNLESEQKEVSDTIADTIKKRRAEMIKPFDTQLSDLQGQLKKEQSKREKARNVGVKTRIERETAQLTTESREITNRIKMISSRNGVPGYCSSSLFQIMSAPKGLKEIIIFLVMLVLAFVVIPVGAWLLWGNHSVVWLIIAYVICILVFGGLYYLFVIRNKQMHSDEIKEISLLRDERALKKESIDRITKDIKNDQSDEQYNLAEFDIRINELNGQISQLEQQKKAAIEQFDGITQQEITDEIMGKNVDRLEQMKTEIDDMSAGLEDLNARLRTAGVENTTKYESVLGSEFTKPAQIERLAAYIRNGQAYNLNEAKELYRAGAKLRTGVGPE